MKDTITGIILVGGKSRRMGAEKAFLLHQNIPLIEHSINALEKVTSEIILVGGDDAYTKFGKRLVTDIYPNAGPLGGLYTGLHHSKTQKNLVLACDTPLINEVVLQLLIDEVEAHVDGVQLQHKMQKMPLIGLYKDSCKLQLQRELETGERKLQTAIAKLNMKTVDVPVNLVHCTLNVNTPDDLKVLEKGNY